MRAGRRAAQKLSHKADAGSKARASMASEPRDRSAPTKRRARARVGEFEGRSPSNQTRLWRGGIHVAVRRTTVITSAALAVVAAASLSRPFAQASRTIGPLDQKLFADMRWRSVGPLRG